MRWIVDYVVKSSWLSLYLSPIDVRKDSKLSTRNIHCRLRFLNSRGANGVSVAKRIIFVIVIFF